MIYKKKKDDQRKNYQTFGVFLKGKKYKLLNHYILAGLFLQKFTESNNPTDWQKITAEDLKTAGINVAEDYKTYYGWRETMLKKGILICQATDEEIKGDVANHKCNMFKPHTNIMKYIKIGRDLNLPEVVYKHTEDIEALKAENKGIKEENKEIKEELKSLSRKIEKVAEFVLKALPPDTPIRRDIVNKKFGDFEACFKELEEEKKNKSLQ
ncbi:hypothetical protein [Silvanigrella sp.]|jgi:hypothetical protein|uniref:hypothetical protein n=1 Tax=Silvanigrella sp. TaxID=2024976 RepID=UPI0037CC8EAD